MVLLQRMSANDICTQLLESSSKKFISKHNRVARKYNQIKKKQFIRYAMEEAETLYPSLPKTEFDVALWNKLVVSELGSPKKYKNPYFVKHSSI